MAREASAAIQLQALGTLLNILSADEGDESSVQFGESLAAIQLTTGVEDNQINRAISKRNIALSSGATLTLDVFDFAGFDVGAGDGRDGVGQTIALDEIVAIVVVLKAGSAGSLRIGAEGSGACFNSIFDGRDDAKVIIKATASNPAIFFIFSPSTDGYAVVDVSNHLLKFEAVSGAVTFNLHIMGRDNP